MDDYVLSMEQKRENAIDLQGKSYDVRNGFFTKEMAVKNGTLVIKEDIDLKDIAPIGIFNCTIIGGMFDYTNKMIRRIAH